MKLIPIEVYQQAALELSYDPASRSCIRKNGKEVGTPDGNGYWLVRVGKGKGTLLKCHRVVWFLHHGTVPPLIEHKDRNPSNNLITNLREATESQNRCNTPKHCDNTSGAKGVFWCKSTSKWMVKVCVNYKTYWGGRHADLETAIAVATELRNKLHGEYVNHD